MPSLQDRLPVAAAAPDRSPQPSDGDRRAVRGATELVASGVALRIVLVGLDGPCAVVAELEAEATGARVPLSVDEGSHDQSVIVGPRSS